MNREDRGQDETQISPLIIRNVLLLGLLTWLLLALTYSGALNPASGLTGLDFKVFYPATIRVSQGLPLYQANLDKSVQNALYVYSPLPAELMRPLAHLSFQTALKVWFFLNAGCLILAVLLYGAAARLTWRAVPLLGILMIVSFRFWDNTLNFSQGQSNDILLGMIAAMIWADSRGRWGLMGALIVLASLFKIWMIGLLLYLLLRRQWKPFLLSVGGFAVSLGILFSLIGWRELPSFLTCLKQSKAAQEAQEVQNSIVGFAGIHLRANPFITPLVKSEIAYLGFIVVCTALVLAGFVFLWRVLRSPTPLEARLAFGLTLTSILLLLPTYENGYFVYCFPLLWTLLASPEADLISPSGEPLHAEKPLRSGGLSVPHLMLGAGIVIYLVFSRSWPFYAPFPPLYQHGLGSLLVSMKFFGTAACWLVGMAALWKLQKFHKQQPQTRV